MITVVCFKWFDPRGRWNSRFVYGAEHVNRLRRMVARHLAIPHRFVCATDDATGLDADIGVVPLNPRLTRIEPRHRFPKLDIFRPDAARLYGDRILSLDLDCVITGPLDPLLDGISTPFKIWGDTVRDTPYNSSMIYLESGTRAQVYRDFDPETSPARIAQSGMVGTDQAWIAIALGPHEERWTSADGVLSYKRDCMRAVRGRLPWGARIVFFHGNVDPSLPELQAKSPWIVRHWH